MTQDDLTKLALIKLAMESGFDKILDEHASEYRDGTFDRSEYPELLAFVNLVAGMSARSVRGCVKTTLATRRECILPPPSEQEEN